jgi:inhibitor of cysteine peptidase
MAGTSCGHGEKALAGTPSPATPPLTATASDGTFVHGKASVESIEVFELESFPVQIVVVARGNLPDGCTEIDQVNVNSDRERHLFRVEITTVRERAKICTQATVPFERNARLDVYGLPAGTYTVDVNGVTDSFTLAQDNVLK